MTTETPPPLGLTKNDVPWTFAVATAPDARAVFFCVERSGTETRAELPNRLGAIWWGVVDVQPGDRYGIRVEGPGFDPKKLLLDPWARAVDGTVNWLDKPGCLLPGSNVDTGPYVPWGIVVDDRFDWTDDRPPRTAWVDTVLYEVHVKGATMAHPGIPEAIRGTYAGLAHPAFTGHLQRVGVTAVELLPIHHHVAEERLATLGLTNYWGYNTLGFFAPHQAYASESTRGAQVGECKAMVKALHAAGIEVILDVVYNHTCEGGHGGPTVSLRGLHGDALYREVDTTGCGNTLDLRHPLALRLVLDSLRMWVEEYHVDGFRFDLATAVARGTNGDFDQRGLFLAAIGQDPVLSQVKLIAEPWDVGDGGYQLGFFPAPWAEWNDRYRGLVRDHWRDAPRPLGALARRITGNPDLFARSGRWPWSSINFVTAHDGFTMADLVTYELKRNKANGENNADGTSDNRSWNHGVEGPTLDAKIVASRARTVRNLLATLLFSHGTPMILGGDELGRTQLGNNNAYCHDSSLVWIDWVNADHALTDFTATLTRLRREHRALHRATWLNDDEAQWFAPDGTAMTVDRWDDPNTAGLTLLLDGHGDEPDLALLMYEGPASIEFTLPKGEWTMLLSTDPAWVVPPNGTVFEGVETFEPRTIHLYARA